MSIKKLHTFTVPKTVVKKVEEKTEDGILTKEIKSVEDIGCFVKLPGRREIEQMRVIQSAEFGKAVAMGVQSRESMRTAILNQGGFAYAKADLEELDILLPELNLKRNEYQKIKVDGGDTSEIEVEFQELYGKVQKMEARLLEVYEHTAESISERETTLWAVLNLLHWESGQPVFTGHADETRRTNYYAAFDDAATHQAEVAAFERAFLILDAFLFKGVTEDKMEDFAELIRSE